MAGLNVLIRNLSYYPLASMVGFCTGSGTHAFTFPLETLKYRSQLGDAIVERAKMHGLPVPGLYRGMLATLIGWGIHGSIRFSLYDWLKINVFGGLGRTRVIVAALVSEGIATIILCPFQVIEIRLKSDPLFATGSINALSRTLQVENGFYRLYDGFTVLLVRQLLDRLIDSYVHSRVILYMNRLFGVDPDDLPALAQTTPPQSSNVYNNSKRDFKKLFVAVIGAGIVGTLAALLTNGVDVVFVHKVATPEKTIPAIISQLGFSGLFRGLGYRILLSSTHAFLYWQSRIAFISSWHKS